eukprot:TRINITY_DN53071_c0_g1_i1.p1 TRINITY_DN53071_c0_g1~~TRINITY_DN53071_c0_g1_i1.p1  ORF type:complete len:323 (+),score=59.06 TRINITY_DN53071_c0_g1_i1:28-969(+)
MAELVRRGIRRLLPARREYQTVSASSQQFRAYSKGGPVEVELEAKKGDNSSSPEGPRWTYRHPLRQRLAAKWKGNTALASGSHHTSVERTAAKISRQPEILAEMMSNLPKEQRRAIALSWALTELEEEFAKADKDSDGKLSYKEFREWALKVIDTGPKRQEVTRVSQKQCLYVALAAFIPFVGFGAVDNGLMVIYGDVIDGTLGVTFGFSMLASAALGNAVSNIFGMLLHGTITKQADKIGLPDPRLTLAQQKLPRVHYWSTAGSTIGVFTGCILGMSPLLFMNQTEKEEARSAGKLHHEPETKDHKTEKEDA